MGANVNTPPLPAGFTLDQPDSGVPPLPEGFTVDVEQTTAIETPEGSAVETVQAQPMTIGQMMDANPNIAMYEELIARNQGDVRTAGALGEVMSREIQQTAKMHSLRQKNPELADMIEGMSDAEKSAVGFGRGLTDIARGFGLAGDEQSTEALDQLQQFTPGEKGARTLGQMAPFAPLGTLASGLKALPATAAYSGIGATEGYTSATGEGVDPTLRTAIGAAAPFAIYGAMKVGGKAAEKIAQNREARERAKEILKIAQPEVAVDKIEEVAKLAGPNSRQQIAAILEDSADVNHPIIKSLRDKGTTDPAKVAEEIAVQRNKAIESEAAEYALKGPNNVKKSPAAKKALSLGARPGDVQLYAGATTADKAKFTQILNRAKAAEKSATAKLDIHPQEVVGESINERLKFVNKLKENSGKKIDRIAENELRQVPIQLDKPMTEFVQKLEKMGITFADGALDFERSALKGMPDMQKQIADVVERLSPSGMPNATAYDAHILKQWFDNQINWGKSAQGGIPPKVENAIKGLRRGVNEEIGKLSPAYKKANTQYSDSIDAISKLKGLAGRNTDMNGEFIEETLGMLAKRVSSNAMSRGRVKEAIKTLEDVSAKYGKVYPDNIGRQVAAVNALEKKLGSFSDTSLKGQTITETAVDAVDSPVRAGINVLKEAVGKSKTVDNIDFIESLEALIKGK